MFSVYKSACPIKWQISKRKSGIASPWVCARVLGHRASGFTGIGQFHENTMDHAAFTGALLLPMPWLNVSISLNRVSALARSWRPPGFKSVVRDQESHEDRADKVRERILDVGRLSAEGPLRCTKLLLASPVSGRSSSVALGTDVVSRLSCLEVVGEVTIVIAGCEDDDAEVLTTQAGPCLSCVPTRDEVAASRSRNVSPSSACLLPLLPLITLFRLP